jgi:recombination protein U
MKKKSSHSNRGKELESMITHSNETYALKGWAFIRKTPNPWIVIRKGKEVFAKPNPKEKLVDYIGVAQGKAVAFDAKTSKETTRFPLANIHQDQMDFLKSWSEQGGIAFFLIWLETLNEYYIVSHRHMDKFWSESLSGGRKSIPYSQLKLFPSVKSGRGVAIDYLKEILP